MAYKYGILQIDSVDYNPAGVYDTQIPLPTFKYGDVLPVNSTSGGMVFSWREISDLETIDLFLTNCEYDIVSQYDAFSNYVSVNGAIMNGTNGNGYTDIDAQIIISNQADTMTNMINYCIYISGMTSADATSYVNIKYSEYEEMFSSSAYNRVYNSNGGTHKELLLKYITYIDPTETDIFEAVIYGESINRNAMFRYTVLGELGTHYNSSIDGLSDFIWGEGEYSDANGSNGLQTFTLNSPWTYTEVRDDLDNFFFK